MARLPVTGALLAGGRGSRLGGAVKAEMELGGETLFDRAVRFLESLCEEVVVLPGSHRLGGPRGLPDALPDRGAPGALLAALEAARCPWVFALAVDMPRPSGAAARALFARLGSAQAACYVREGRLEPLFAFYAKGCAPTFRRRLARRGASFAELLSLVEAVRLPLCGAPKADRDGRFLANVNTPADAEALGIGPPNPLTRGPTRSP
ncbi:MAG: molybdenum cofactor guanylyltransferase [Myxococcales bacterium]